MTKPCWIKVDKYDKLKQNNRMIFRHQGKQILLIRNEDEIFAVNNRCPHEGYPLSEGTMSKDCQLTCHWHNWKFDLSSGETLVGGDRLRHYPVRYDDAEGLWIDVQDPPGEEIRHSALDNIQDSFDRYEFDRMARELGRFKLAGGDYSKAVADCIQRNYDRFEYGMGHAFAASADWLAFAKELEENGQDDEALTAILEIISHVAWDVRREQHYSFTTKILSFDSEVFTHAIEQEDENKAVALARGALSEGLTYEDIEPALVSAALAHYNDFGHSVIYVYKVGELIRQLGEDVTLALLLSLIRHLIYTSREDLIPEFSRYSEALSSWDGNGYAEIKAEDLRGAPINKSMDRILKSSADIDGIFDALHQTLAWNMLHFDLDYDQATDNQVAQNIGWLDFTHGLTFANAAKVLCGRYPEYWPQALLQLACFSGRNVAYIDRDQDVSKWHIPNPKKFFKDHFTRLIDHGVPEPIVSCHLMKVLTAVKDDTEHMPEGETKTMLLASTNRFLNSPLKRKHGLRTAKQALNFVELEG